MRLYPEPGSRGLWNSTAAQPRAPATLASAANRSLLLQHPDQPNQDRNRDAPDRERLSRTAPATHETRPNGPGLTCEFDGGRCWVRTNVGQADGFTDSHPSACRAPGDQPLLPRRHAHPRGCSAQVPRERNCHSTCPLSCGDTCDPPARPQRCHGTGTEPRYCRTRGSCECDQPGSRRGRSDWPRTPGTRTEEPRPELVPNPRDSDNPAGVLGVIASLARRFFTCTSAVSSYPS